MSVLWSGAVNLIHCKDDGSKYVPVLSYTDYLRFTTGWDGQLLQWDLRSGTPVASLTMSGKAHSLSINGDRAVVATSARRVDTINYSQGPAYVEESRESPLKCQLRRVKCLMGKEGYVLCSIEVSGL